VSEEGVEAIAEVSGRNPGQKTHTETNNKFTEEMKMTTTTGTRRNTMSEKIYHLPLELDEFVEDACAMIREQISSQVFDPQLEEWAEGYHTVSAEITVDGRAGLFTRCQPSYSHIIPDDTKEIVLWSGDGCIYSHDVERHELYNDWDWVADPDGPYIGPVEYPDPHVAEIYEPDADYPDEWSRFSLDMTDEGWLNDFDSPWHKADPVELRRLILECLGERHPQSQTQATG
jgi:hypothetical protein